MIWTLNSLIKSTALFYQDSIQSRDSSGSLVRTPFSTAHGIAQKISLNSEQVLDFHLLNNSIQPTALHSKF